MSSDEIVERVREAADILKIIGEHVKLRRSGADWRGPCPFHGGKNPNFSVSPKRGQYHCFKCGESGDVFSFVQNHLGLSFPDALQTVAGIAGIEIPEQRRADKTGPDHREPFWEMNAVAADFFKRSLWDGDQGAAARTYLEQRGVTREISERFELGLAPSDPGALRAHMEMMGFYLDRLVEGGLVLLRDGSTEPRPRFRNRLMFPILDAQGRHTAFGGRALGNFEPKYLNSPETPVFNKSQTLYALNWCRNGIRKADRAFVVEGYMDAIRLMASGIDSVVAPLGTALTESQAKMLARYSKNIYLLYDSDQAGLKATFRAGDELLRHQCSVRVVTLPNGEDPDTYVLAHGASGLEEQVARALDVFERKIQILDRGGWFDELQKKRRALDRLLPTIRAASDPLLRDLYVTRAAEKTGVAKEILLREAEGSPREVVGPLPEGRTPERPRSERSRSEVRARSGDRRNDHRARGHAAERELVRAILADPQRGAVIAEKVDPERFLDDNYRAIFSAMLELGDDFTVESLADELGEDDVAVLNGLLDEPGAQIDPEKTVSASLAALAMRDIDGRLAQIDTILSLATEDEKIELANEKIRLQKEIELLGQPASKSFKFLRRRLSAPIE
ncbi:MAG: DNA primase [Gemmatimonadaceae bacterium]